MGAPSAIRALRLRARASPPSDCAPRAFPRRPRPCHEGAAVSGAPSNHKQTKSGFLYNRSGVAITRPRAKAHRLQKRSILYDCGLTFAPLLRPCHEGAAVFAARGGCFSRAPWSLVQHTAFRSLCPVFRVRGALAPLTPGRLTPSFLDFEGSQRLAGQVRHVCGTRGP